MLHFDGQFLSIKKAMFVVKRGEYFRKCNIFEVDFDSGVCTVSIKKEYMTSHPSFILQTSIFVQKSLKMGQNGPLYREICLYGIFDFYSNQEQWKHERAWTQN